MFQFGQKHIILLCFLLLLITGILILLFPIYYFISGGLITAIMITLFIKNDNVTRVASLISIILIILSGFIHYTITFGGESIIQTSYSLLLIIGTTMLVLYVKRLYRKLEGDEGQLNALFHYATEGILLTNKDGEIILINPEAERIFGYNKEELLGSKIEKLIPLRFTGRHEQYRTGFNAHPASRRMGEGRDLFGLRRDGSEFPVEVSLSYFNQNKAFYVLAFVVDITLRKQNEKHLLQQKNALEKMAAEMKTLNTNLEEEVKRRTINLTHALEDLEKSRQDLKESLNKEKELNEIKSKFVSMASHEFRTPLSTILSSASLVGRYPLTDQQPQRDKHVVKIKDAVKQLNNLLEDFLSLGKLEEGKVDIKQEEFDVDELLEEIIEEIKALLKTNQVIKLTKQGDTTFKSDKRLIKAILYNLLTNAGKFSPDNAAILLNVDCNENLSMEVIDHGIGIPEEEKNHLFSSFFRASNVTNIQGTGLGLHIVKRYVTLLKGKILLNSKLNEGTSVQIILPELK
jgi:PAS domain S-box-containing protein